MRLIKMLVRRGGSTFLPDGCVPQRTRARHVYKPRIDTFRMELVIARKYPQILALDEVVRTDWTGEIACIGRMLGIRFGNSSRAFRMFFSDRNFRFTWRGLSGGDILVRAGSRVLPGIVRIGHFDIALGRIHVIVFSFIAEFDDGNRVEHSPCYTSCSTLSWPASHPARAIPFWMTVGTDGTRDDDAQEQYSDDPRNAVQDNHRCLN